MQTNYQDPRFRLTGHWQENSEGELVSYKRIAMAAIRFRGTQITVNARLDGDALWYLDDVQVEPQVLADGFQFCAEDGEHRLKVVLVSPSRMYLRDAQTDGEFLAPEERPYVWMWDTHPWLDSRRMNSFWLWAQSVWVRSMFTMSARRRIATPSLIRAWLIGRSLCGH